MIYINERSIEFTIDGHMVKMSHRVGGPAIIHSDGFIMHFLNDIPYTKEEYHEKMGGL